MSGTVVDLVFALDGHAVALDYADRLWRALQVHLPWLGGDALAGIHPLAGVSPGDSELYLTRRARMTLRLPAERIEAARALTGRRIDLGGDIGIGEASEKPLVPFKTLYSSFVTLGTDVEADFLAACGARLKEAGIPMQLVCGKAQVGRGQDGDWRGFSLMLFGLNEEESLRMQRQGLGGERKRGCGIFVPHKSVAPLRE